MLTSRFTVASASTHTTIQEDHTTTTSDDCAGWDRSFLMSRQTRCCNRSCPPQSTFFLTNMRTSSLPPLSPTPSCLILTQFHGYKDYCIRVVQLQAKEWLAGTVLDKFHLIIGSYLGGGCKETAAFGHKIRKCLAYHNNGPFLYYHLTAGDSL